MNNKDYINELKKLYYLLSGFIDTRIPAGLRYKIQDALDNDNIIKLRSANEDINEILKNIIENLLKGEN